MQKTYTEFLLDKVVTAKLAGFEVDESQLNPMLFDWQKTVVKWALRIGKAALFEECGLGKTPQQLEWSKHVAEHTGQKVIILAPLAVAHQTVREGKKFGIDAIYCRNQEQAEQAKERIIIANYEMLDHFDTSYYGGVVLDESSILKNFTGKTKRKILRAFENTPFKLCCTATPAPNDHLELGNHAEFLNVMRSNEMISRWFINDSMQAGGYRLKKYAHDDYWRWVTTWAVCISIPSDIGFDDDGFILPALHVEQVGVTVDQRRAWDMIDKHGQRSLILDGSLSATGIWKDKKQTAPARVAKAMEIIGDSKEPWIIWCNTNHEADLLIKAFCDMNYVEVRGSHSIEQKEDRLRAFAEGDAQIIITKSEIAGFGLNWQHCTNQVFVGMTYSFEAFYQALRRSWRFGVQKPVNVYVIFAESESGIQDALTRKQDEFREMQREMNEAMKKNGLFRDVDRRAAKIDIETEMDKGRDWTLYLGDCVEVARQLETESVHHSVFSPPFSTLYIYSDSVADMGNTANHDEFFAQFDYLICELWRLLKPGRLVAVHCKDLPLYMNRDGAAGLYDFPGDLIKHFEQFRFDENYQISDDPKHVNRRWAYHSRVTIWKDPVIEMQRTKNHGLLWKNYSQRGEVVRQGMADYVIIFRKWVDMAEMPDKQVDNTEIEYIGQEPPEYWDSERDKSIQIWQKYASPVWFDIDQTNVLNFRIARENEDEKHICPLQLDVIARCIQLWSNPGEVVFTPFAGVGSELYQAIKMGRKAVGIELKRSYYEHAAKYLREVELQPDMFAMNGI